MGRTSDEIIRELEKKFPRTTVQLENLHDDLVEVGGTLYNQFLLGVTADYGQHDVRSRYTQMIADKFPAYLVRPGITCWPYTFDEEDLKEMMDTLRDLAKYYDIDFDFERADQTIQRARKSSKQFYIMVTILQYPIVHAGTR